MDNQSIGVRLYNLRVDADYTQEDLAFKLNVSRQSISKWELDKTLPDTQKLIDLANLYGVSLDYIILGTEMEANNSSSDSAVNEETADSTTTIEESSIEKATEDNNAENIIVSEPTYQKPSKANRILHYARIFFALITGLLCIGLLIFVIEINSNLAVVSDDMESIVVMVDNVYEQYTLAEVTSFENDKVVKKKLWLDSNNLSQGDSIFAFVDKSNPSELKFQYYKKSLLTPLVVMMLFLTLFIYFVIAIYHDSKSR